MCRICWDPVESLVELTELNCFCCPDLVAIPPELVHLATLDCSGCPRLSSIPDTLVELRTLDCSRCPLLVSIPPKLANLAHLFCYGCSRLASIPDALMHLRALDCASCRLLTSIPPDHANSVYQNFAYCPWLPQNAAKYPAHFPSLLRLQRWFRTGKKQVFKRVIRTRAFNEFVFHPDRIGGKLVKRQMEAELDAMRPAKQHRVE